MQMVEKDLKTTKQNQMSQPKPRRGRPNKYKGESEFYATVIPKGMKAEADEVMHETFKEHYSFDYLDGLERKKNSVQRKPRKKKQVKAKQSKPEQDEQS